MTIIEGNIVTRMDPKAEYDEKDYGFRYGPKGLATGDTLIASTWEIRDSADDSISTDLVIISATIIDSAKTSQVWLRGGIAGKTYKITNFITTAGGRKQALAFLLPVV